MPISIGLHVKCPFFAKSEIERNRLFFPHVNQIKTEPKKFFNYTRHFTRSSSTVDVLEKDGVKSQ